LGFDFLAVSDHVLMPDRSFHTTLSRPYTHDSIFREPLVTFAFIAAVTTRIQFLSSILIAPQRQTALLAKQAAEVELLAGGGRLPRPNMFGADPYAGEADLAARREAISEAARTAGRDPATISISLAAVGESPEAQVASARQMQAFGGTHVTLHALG